MASLPLDGGQVAATAMHVDHTTQTVLIADALSLAVYERAFDGSLVRTFVMDQVFKPLGVTRGPNGEVIVAGLLNQVARWEADGTFIDSTELTLPSGVFPGAGSILWAGTVPEPGSLGLLAVIGASLCGGRARYRRRLDLGG